jgi:hypothetical protein
MAIEAGKDYVYAPKLSRMGGAGVLTGVLVGTKKYLFVVPYESIGGGGRTIETRKYTLAGGDPRKTVPALLADEQLTIEDLEESLRGIVGDIDGEVLTLAEFDRFKIEVGGGLFGWLKAGLYYKTGGKRRWTGFGVSGKANRQALYDFYKDQLHPDAPNPYAAGS